MSNLLVFSSGNQVSAHIPATGKLLDEFTAALHSTTDVFNVLKATRK